METRMQKRIQRVLSDIEELQENLLDLSDDISQSVQHKDRAAADQFQTKYDQYVEKFNGLGSQISELVQHHTGVSIDQTDEDEQIAVDLNTRIAYPLDTDFTYKLPWAFALQGKKRTNLTTWKNLYVTFCKMLGRANKEILIDLPENARFTTPHGKHHFSFDRSQLEVPTLIRFGVYAETSYSASRVVDRMKKLLAEFGIPESECQIFLSKDRKPGVDDL